MTAEYVAARRFEQACDLLTPANSLVLRVAEQTGLRIGDVLALRTENLSGRQFWITEQKTGKRRRVNLTQELLCEMRAQAGLVYVFEGRLSRDKHRTRQAVWYDLKRACKALRMSENVTPHSARKMYAVGLMEKYGDIKRVQRALNHSSAEVTLLYALADRLPARKRRKVTRS